MYQEKDVRVFTWFIMQTQFRIRSAFSASYHGNSSFRIVMMTGVQSVSFHTDRDNIHVGWWECVHVFQQKTISVLPITELMMPKRTECSFTQLTLVVSVLCVCVLGYKQKSQVTKDYHNNFYDRNFSPLNKLWDVFFSGFLFATLFFHF